MNVSFVVISNGKKIDKTLLVFKSIYYQKVPNYEILLCGSFDTGRIPKPIQDKTTYIKEPQAAAAGLLGDMRNRACNQANYENITVLDDDMVLSMDWYKNLLKFGEDFDILTSKVTLPEGTRFWDRTCFCPPESLGNNKCYGHVILEPHESDEHLYMSGGQAWVMKKYVHEGSKWSKAYSTGKRASMKNEIDYMDGKHNEDTDFSKRCREAGFKIKHNHDMLAFHNDATYSCVGRICNPRQENRTYEWIKDHNMNKFPEEIVKESQDLYRKQYVPEAADVLRYGLLYHFNNALLINALKVLDNSRGGNLQDSNWNIDGCPIYNKEIEFYKNYDYS